MTGRDRPALVSWLLTRAVPIDWRDPIAGDLEEERRRRHAQHRYAGALWQAAAVVTAGVRLAWARRRDRRGTPALPVTRRAAIDYWRSDLAHAARGLAAHRGYAATAVLTLAIGIGANAAIFNLANWLLLRPLPGVADEARLVSVGFGSADGTRLTTSVADAQTIAASTPGVTSLAGYLATPAHVAAIGGPARRITAEIVSGGYFDVLGMRMIAGRGFTPEEGADPSRPPTAVISHRLWTRDFAAATDVIGRTIVVNRQPVTVIGVTARGFHGPSLSGATDVWMPVAQHRVVAPAYPATILTSRRSGLFFGLIGRLAPNATSQVVDGQIESARAALAAANPADARLRRWRFFVTPGAESHPWERRQLGETFTMLSGIVALLLLLTAANAGNLMVGRASARRDEIATRLALGASRGAIARLLFAEGLLLSAMAGTAALALAWLTARLLTGTILMQGLPPLEPAELDWRVLGYAVLVSAAVAMLAGMFPALTAARVDVNAALRASGRSQTAQRQRIRRLLTTAQVAVSVALLIGAALFVRSMSKRLAIDPGFDPSRVMTMSIAPGLQDYGARPSPFYGDLLDRVRAIPGVRAAGLAWLRPSNQRIGSDTLFHPEGAADTVRIGTDTNTVSPGFFAAVGLPIVDGRDFSEAEFQAAAGAGADVVIMTASLARKAFDGAPAVGRTIVLTGETKPRAIVGVVRDTHQRGLTATSTDMLFLPFSAAAKFGWASVIVGLGAPDRIVAPRLRQAVAELDPTLPTYDVMRMDDAIRLEFVTEALVMRLTIIFAALATIVAAIGLYGVLARGVADRRREFGIRVALGAGPGIVAGLVARESLTVLIAGVALGGTASAWFARYLDSQLYGVTRLDGLSFAGAAVIVSIVMLIATAPVGRRAARVDPASVLRA